MISLSSLKNIDSKRMFEVYDKWPEIATEAYENTDYTIEIDKISHIVFAGMGGSGAIGDIFSSILSKKPIHVDVVKGYQLPKTVNSDTLVIPTSISGDTEETVSILLEAMKLKSKIICFSSGGELEKICLKNKINHGKIEMKHSPRASFPIFLFSMLRTLESNLPLEKIEILNSLHELKTLRERISSKNIHENNESISLAKWISNTPLIYYPEGLMAASTRFKNSLQENSKMHAITENVIEACHNGIVSWKDNSDFKPILIQGKDDHFKTKQRWNILKEFFEIKRIDYKEIHSINGGILSKLINLIYFFDYSTIYKAVIKGVDPTPVDPIDFVKKSLRKNNI